MRNLLRGRLFVFLPDVTPPEPGPPTRRIIEISDQDRSVSFDSREGLRIIPMDRKNKVTVFK